MAKTEKLTLSEAEFERQYNEATRRGKERLAKENRAHSLSYDQDTNRLVIDLENGATLVVPCDLVQGLRDADPSLIAKGYIGPRNAHLWWDELDVQFTVDGLLSGIFGTKRWMSELGKLGGKAKSKTKAASSRENGKKGGRPKKQREVA